MSNKTISIALVNKYASDYSKNDMKKLAKAINKQIKEDFAPLWPIIEMPDVFFLEDAGELKKTTNYWPVYLHPGNTALWTAGITGFHTTMRRVAYDDSLSAVLNLPSNIKRIAIATDDRPCACVLTKSDDSTDRTKFVEVSKSVSAEVMEMITNPKLVATKAAGTRVFEYGANMFTGTLIVDGAPFFAFDTPIDCTDAVRNDSYTIDAGDGSVTVSNAVSEAWYSADYANLFYQLTNVTPFPPVPWLANFVPPPPNVIWDIMGTTPGPFELSGASTGNAIGYVAQASTVLGNLIEEPDFRHPDLEVIPDTGWPGVPPRDQPPYTGHTTLGDGQVRVAKDFFSTNGSFVFSTHNSFPELTAATDLEKFMLEKRFPWPAPTP